MITDFQRARSEEQRALRRQSILSTTAGMLTEMPVSQLSLNELSRRVGLAKSNVLRYFESREAILLELLDAEAREWVADVDRQIEDVDPGDVAARAEFVTGVIASTLAARPVLCDLMHAESGVLERNVSVEAVLRHKYATQQMATEIARVLTTAVPELTAEDAVEVIVALLLVAAAAWPYAQPGDALAAAYAHDPTVGAMHRDFTTLVQRTLTLTIRGLLAEKETLAPTGGVSAEDSPAH